MIRRDYILRMLAEFFEVLARMRSLQKAQQWSQARDLAEKEFQQLIGSGADAALRLSDTELMACLIRGASLLPVREKSLMLTAILKESGDIAMGQGTREVGRAYYLKGLHLLLSILAHETVSDAPELVPRVELFLNALADGSLPLSTQAMLMQHYERLGEFGKAEDLLFGMIEDQPENTGLVEFGIAFYRRAEAQSDDALLAGNLPRNEVGAGLAQLMARQSSDRSRQVTGPLS